MTTVFKNILVPTDFGDAAAQALEMAISLAERYESKITLLHVYLLPSMGYGYARNVTWPVEEVSKMAEREVQAAADEARHRFARIEAALAQGDAVTEILGKAKALGADLIVMGTHGRRGLSRMFLGSVAENAVRLASVPVMTVLGKEERVAKRRALADALSIGTV
jgi:nucleotide-binding universal stress UspA family protein